MTETKSETKAAAKDTKSFLVSVPGSGGVSVVQGADSKDAVAQYVVSAGITPIQDADGNDTVQVGVLELPTESVDQDAVKGITEPED